MAHAFYSPSKAHMWGHCPAALTFPENQPQPETISSKYADDGTATHHWAAIKLRDKAVKIGDTFDVNGKPYVLDEDRLDRIIRYRDWVQVICGGRPMFIEHHVDMRPLVDTDGTCDVGHIMQVRKEWGWEAIALDLKDGSGEKVDAKDNFQGGMYLIGLLNDAKLLGYKIKGGRVGICQPKLGTYDIWPPLDQPPIPIADLLVFAKEMQRAIDRTEEAMVEGGDPWKYAVPFDEKTCRWCNVKDQCVPLRLKFERIIGMDFEDLTKVGAPLPPRDLAKLGEAFSIIPQLKQWMAAVHQSVWKAVAAGTEVPGSDGLPLKFVEGKKGDRKWIDEKKAEEALCTMVSPDKLYQPATIVSPTKIAAILDKAGTKDIWADITKDHISRTDGKPTLALGSDKRSAYSGAASADDFEVVNE